MIRNRLQILSQYLRVQLPPNHEQLQLEDIVTLLINQVKEKNINSNSNFI